MPSMNKRSEYLTIGVVMLVLGIVLAVTVGLLFGIAIGVTGAALVALGLASDEKGGT
jgi:hypothetical protein